MWARLKPWASPALALLFPEVCQFCGEHRARPQDGYVCPDCRSRPGAIQIIRPPFCERCGLPYSGSLTTAFTCSNCEGVKLYFAGARSACVARSLVLEAVHRYKYRRHLWLENFLVDLLLLELRPWLEAHPVDVLIPVPLHPQKEREREYNQSARMAARAARLLGLPCARRALRRVRDTGTQTALTREARVSNMRKAFAINRRYPVNGKRVLLIDDVFTTGATTNACARVLHAAGAAAVWVWTVARGV